MVGLSVFITQEGLRMNVFGDHSFKIIKTMMQVIP